LDWFGVRIKDGQTASIGRLKNMKDQNKLRFPTKALANRQAVENEKKNTKRKESKWFSFCGCRKQSNRQTDTQLISTNFLLFLFAHSHFFMIDRGLHMQRLRVTEITKHRLTHTHTIHNFFGGSSRLNSVGSVKLNEGRSNGFLGLLSGAAPAPDAGPAPAAAAVAGGVPAAVAAAAAAAAAEGAWPLSASLASAAGTLVEKSRYHPSHEQTPSTRLVSGTRTTMDWTSAE
jgi:hypothetical protein